MYTVLLYASKVQLDSIAKHVVAYLPVLAALLLVLWDLQAWRWPLIHQLTHRPRIDGLWRVVLQPTAESHIPEGGNRGPISAYVMVSQSFWSLHVRQLTVESGSRSRAVVWEDRGEADVERLSFLYENDPRPEHLERSHRHLGSCTFSPANLKPKTMPGVYFTDRYTQGSMDLTLIDRSKGYSTFHEAADYDASVQ